MENFSYQQLLDTLKEVSLELFSYPYGMAGVTAPESHGPVGPCHVLDKGGTIWKNLYYQKLLDTIKEVS